jgi:hypothetical protein
MKKTYKTPLTEVVKVNAVQLICQSIVNVNGDAGVGKGGSVKEGGYSSDSKAWDDYDEDLW